MRNIKPAFSSIIGNEALKYKLQNDISSQNLSHAYIIEGKKGSGKHTIAMMIAAALACEKVNDASLPLPCLNCPSCKKILAGKSPDVIKITRQDKATLGVDSVRFLKNDVRTVPNELDYKIYVIEDAHTMTDQAQNAFLLTLEEPPAFVKFFLLCEDSDSLLETIRSRAQTLRTSLLDEEQIDAYLQANIDDAKRLKPSDPEIYSDILKSAENSIGHAIELLEAKNMKNMMEKRKLTTEFLNLLSLSNTSNNSKAAALIPKLEAKRDVFIEQMLMIETALRDLIVLNRSENAPLLFFSNRDEALALSDSTNIYSLMSAHDALQKMIEAIDDNANVKLSLVNFFSEIKIL